MENAQILSAPKKNGCLHILLVIIIILLVAILGSMWWLKRNMFASEFTPVNLRPAEQILLDAKLNQMDPSIPATKPADIPEAPEAYREDAANRRVTFTERELNAILAKDSDLARKVLIDLSDNLVSIKFIAPMEKDIPVLGGKTMKLSMGLSLSYESNKPSAIIRGISIGGIPLPGAWWGDIKNKNLVEEFSAEGGFWDMFSKGVEYLEVKDGKFILHLKE